jgi:hypothetical protein
VLDSLWEARQVFALRDALGPAGMLGGARPEQAFHRGAVAASFGMDDQARGILSAFVDRARTSGDTAHVLDAEELLADVDARSGRYAEAARWMDSLLRTPTADSVRHEEWVHGREVWAGLRSVPPQRLARLDTAPVAMRRDLAGLLTVPVYGTNAADSVEMIFDTGAGLTVLTAGAGARLGLRLTGDSTAARSITGGYVHAALGELPRLRVGGSVVEHVAVLVMRDEDLSFPQAHYAIRGIVGFPVISALGPVAITRDLRLRAGVAGSPAPLAARNVALSGFTPLVDVAFAGQRGTWALDTGAQTTMAYPPFLARHGAQVRATGQPVSQGLGGAGGTTTISAYRMKSVPLEIGGHTLTVPDLSVLPDPPNPDARRLFGNLGLDALNGANRITLHLAGGWIRIE